VRLSARELKSLERARELLALVRLERYADDYAGVLSGGQRKLLDFAHALMADRGSSFATSRWHE
jgi:ABC-type branched-subunit amino acid transport system ATPase component